MVRCLNTHRDSILPCLSFPNKEIWLKELVNSLVAFAFFLAATITWNWLYRREKTNIIIYSRFKQRECGVLPNRIRLPSPHLTTIHQPLHRNANILSMQFLTNRGFQVAHSLFCIYKSSFAKRGIQFYIAVFNVCSWNNRCFPHIYWRQVCNVIWNHFCRFQIITMVYLFTMRAVSVTKLHASG